MYKRACALKNQRSIVKPWITESWWNSRKSIYFCLIGYVTRMDHNNHKFVKNGNARPPYLSLRTCILIKKQQLKSDKRMKEFVRNFQEWMMKRAACQYLCRCTYKYTSRRQAEWFTNWKSIARENINSDMQTWLPDSKSTGNSKSLLMQWGQ